MSWSLSYLIYLGWRIQQMKSWVYLVLHPLGIAPTFLQLDSWSPGAGFIPIISTKGINEIKKGNL